MLIDTLKELCALPGVSSHEDAVRDYLRAQAAPYVDKIRTDAMGNLILEKKGAVPGGQKADAGRPPGRGGPDDPHHHR